MLLTNFNNSELNKYEETLKIYIKETGDKSLYIDSNAFWRDGTKDNNMSALRSDISKDRSRFWRIFETKEDNNMKKENNDKFEGIGLMDLLQSTFEYNKIDGHDDIYNGLDNALAGINYMLGRYGKSSDLFKEKEVKGKLVILHSNKECDSIGILTPLFDVDNKPLYTGDVVKIDLGIGNRVTSIVCTEKGSIVGLWNASQFDVTSLCIKKIKSYKDLKDGELYYGVKVILDKEEEENPNIFNELVNYMSETINKRMEENMYKSITKQLDDMDSDELCKQRAELEENKYKTEGDNNMKTLTLKEQLEELQLKTKEIESKIKKEDIDRINQIDEKIATYKVKRTETIKGEQYISRDKLKLKLNNTKEMDYDIAYIRKGNKITCKFSNGHIVGKGIARCCDEDTFDYMTGVGLAELRARSDFYKKNAEKLIKDTDKLNGFMGR